MKKLFSILLCCVVVPFTQGQVLQVTTIDTGEYKSAEFESLSFLKEELKDVRILGLGESVHIMGETYTAKVKMVKFLHQQCGFDVIAFEAPMYDLSKINELLKEGRISSMDMAKKNSGVWYTQELLELYDYIIETQKTSHPLIYAGFDESVFTYSPVADVKQDYSGFVKKLEGSSNVTIDLDSAFYHAIDEVVKKCYYYNKIDEKDTLVLFHKFNEIREVLNGMDLQEDLYFKFWKLMTDNLQSIYRKNYRKSNRDKYIAENVKFLANDLYPGKKIMLWAATVHLLYNAKEIKYYSTSKKLNTNKMGTFLKQEYGDQYYLMAFTPYEGTVGVRGYLGLGKHKVKSKKNGLEKYINDTYHPDFAYVRLRNEKVQAALSSLNITRANLTWIKSPEMNVSRIADGIFYIKKERLITPVQ